MTARDILFAAREQDSLETTVQTEPLTNFAKFKEERDKHTKFYGVLTDQEIQEAGEAIKRLYEQGKTKAAIHVYTYFHLETKRQLKSDSRYRHIVKAMYFGGV